MSHRPLNNLLNSDLTPLIPHPSSVSLLLPHSPFSSSLCCSLPVILRERGLNDPFPLVDEANKE